MNKDAAIIHDNLKQLTEIVAHGILGHISKDDTRTSSQYLVYCIKKGSMSIYETCAKIKG